MSDPDHPNPNRLDYQPPAGARPPEGNRRQFWTGLVAGSIASLIFWGLLFLVLFKHVNRPLIPISAFLTIKMLTGIGLSLSRRWKIAGRGLFISLGVGTLIFLSTCGIAFSS